MQAPDVYAGISRFKDIGLCAFGEEDLLGQWVRNACFFHVVGALEALERILMRGAEGFGGLVRVEIEQFCQANLNLGDHRVLIPGLQRCISGKIRRLQRRFFRYLRSGSLVRLRRFFRQVRLRRERLRFRRKGERCRKRGACGKLRRKRCAFYAAQKQRKANKRHEKHARDGEERDTDTAQRGFPLCCAAALFLPFAFHIAIILSAAEFVERRRALFTNLPEMRAMRCSSLSKAIY